MKTILVPTDFSDVSRNAIGYAAEMACHLKARLVLLHTYHVPIVTIDMPANLPSEVEMEREIMIALKKAEGEIREKYGNKVPVESTCRQGLAADAICELASTGNIEMVVMGMQGAGYLTEKLMGSVTTEVIKHSKCPVLVIRKDVKFKKFKKIVLAADYHEINDRALKPLIEITRQFNAHIYILNVIPEPETVQSPKEVLRGIKLAHQLENVGHSFHYCENEGIVDGINEFAEAVGADMVVMISRKHSPMWNFFHEPKTKKMAFHTATPLLALHE